jgi:hypothetical protein
VTLASIVVSALASACGSPVREPTAGPHSTATPERLITPPANMCTLLDPTPLADLGSASGPPASTLTPPMGAACLLSLTTQSNGGPAQDRRNASLDAAGLFHPDAIEAQRYYDSQTRGQTAQHGQNDSVQVGDEGLIFANSPGGASIAMTLFTRVSNLVLVVMLTAHQAVGSWSDADHTAIRDQFIRVVRTTIDRLTS